MRFSTGSSWFLVAVLAAICLAFPPPLEAGWDRGVAAFKAGRLTEAEREFEQVVARQPDWPGGHFMLGQVQLQLRKSAQALVHLKRAYALEPDDISYQYALGQAYLLNGRYSESAQILRRINPASLPQEKQVNYQKLLAAALERSGDSGGALTALKNAAEANPNDTDAWYAYGVAAFNAGETATAVSALEKAAVGADSEKNEAYAKALIRYGREMEGAAKQDTYSKAAAAAQKVASANGSYDNLLLLGEAQLGAKQYDAALSTLKRAASENSNDWLVHYYLAQTHLAAGSYPEAEAAAREAVALASRESDRERVLSLIEGIDEVEQAAADDDEINRLRVELRETGTISLGPDEEESDCLKLVFSKFCLGGPSAELPEPETAGDDYLTYVEDGELTTVRTVGGRVAAVLRPYSPPSWLIYRRVASTLQAKYGSGEDSSVFPDYADDDDSRATSISLGKARASRTWQQTGWTIVLSWEGDSLTLLYYHNTLWGVIQQMRLEEF